jgi:hypothetical protein
MIDNYLYDFNLYEFDINLINQKNNDEKVNKINLPQNIFNYNIVILCNISDRPEELKKILDIISQSQLINPNFENLMLVFTKPDKLDSFKDFNYLQKILNVFNLNNIPHCFLKMRTLDEKNKFKNIQQFYQNSPFYLSKEIIDDESKKIICDCKPISDFLINSYCNYFSHNYNNFATIIKNKFDDEYKNYNEERSELPEEPPKKFLIATNKLGEIINYIKKMCLFTS